MGTLNWGVAMEESFDLSGGNGGDEERGARVPLLQARRSASVLRIGGRVVGDEEEKGGGGITKIDMVGHVDILCLYEITLQN